MNDERRPEPFADRAPPAALAARVGRSLRAQGLIEPESTRRLRQLLTAATFVAVAGSGFLGGRLLNSADPRVDSRPQFLMLLYEDSTYRDDRPITEIVAEYAGWADSLRSERALVLAEKLGEARVELSGGTAEHSGSPTGLFIVRAADLEAAQIIASSSPHLRHGGRVMVHPIDR